MQSLRGRSEIMNFLFTIVVIELCVTRYIQFFTFSPMLSLSLDCGVLGAD